MPEALMSVSSLDSSLSNTELTPSSLLSMEEVTMFPARHLLADLSPSQLDRNFDSPGTGNRFSSTPSSGDRSSKTPSSGIMMIVSTRKLENNFIEGSDKNWWEGEGEESNIPEEIVCEDDAFDKDEFEGRELSVVLEETEAEETDSDYSSGVDIDKVKERLLIQFHILNELGCDRSLHYWCGLIHQNRNQCEYEEERKVEEGNFLEGVTYCDFL